MPGDKLISEDFRAAMNKSGPAAGNVICGSPFEMTMIFDFTGPRGSGSNLYYGYIYQVPKWEYNLAKLDEWMSVTPEWAEFHSITLGQKQKLMETIKSGLASAASAVADYELAAHDARRYREIIDYFKAGQKDEHVLRSLFVDRVDAYTGEGYSLISMAKRWPTIITDFIRMKEDLTDPSKNPDPKQQLTAIRESLDVSQAEATVLKTKNELFRQWKTMFRPTVMERYARIQNMVNARKLSIDEYKSWLKPYLARFKMMKEKLETESSAGELSDPFMTPGFAQSQAFTGVRLWVWKPFGLAELRKAEMGPLPGFPDGMPENRGFLVDPYDDLVKEWKEKIEKHWGVAISDAEVVGGWDKKTDPVTGKESKRWKSGLLKAYTKPFKDLHTYYPRMNQNNMYYVLFDVTFTLGLVKTPPPEAMELDNAMFIPFKGWFMSQNAILVHLLEIHAREKAFEKYVNQMIGASEEEESLLKRVEAEFKQKEEKKEKFKLPKGFEKAENFMGSKIKDFAQLYVKRGPYEPVFKERVSKLMARAIGGMYKQQLDHIQALMGAR